MFSIIIPVYNDPRIFECVRSILDQDYPKDRYEIIIIEDGTSAASDICTSFPGSPIKYFQSERGGSFNARNIGISQAKFPFCAFTDADCLVASDWLQKASQSIDLSTDAIYGGIILSQERSPLNTIELFESIFYLKQKMYQELYGFYATANCFIPTKVLQKNPFVGLANAEEEKELMSWLSYRGLSLNLIEDSKVYHPTKSNFKDFFRGVKRDFFAQKLIKAKTTRLKGNLYLQKIRTLRHYLLTLIREKLTTLEILRLLCLIFIISSAHLFYEIQFLLRLKRIEWNCYDK